MISIVMSITGWFLAGAIGFAIGFILAGIMASSKSQDNCAKCLTLGRVSKYVGGGTA